MNKLQVLPLPPCPYLRGKSCPKYFPTITLMCLIYIYYFSAMLHNFENTTIALRQQKGITFFVGISNHDHIWLFALLQFNHGDTCTDVCFHLTTIGQIFRIYNIGFVDLMHST